MTVPSKGMKMIEFRSEKLKETLNDLIEWVETNKHRVLIDHYENEQVEGKFIIRVYYRRR